MVTSSDDPVSSNHNGHAKAKVGYVEELAEVDPEQVIATVERVARDNPHLALAGAAAIGFVLGGGLTPRIVGAVGLMAARYYFRQVVSETFEAKLRDEDEPE